MGLLIIECLKMKRFIIIQLLAVVFAAQIQAQGDGEIKYRRSSLYSMMINHEGREFGDEIRMFFSKFLFLINTITMI